MSTPNLDLDPFGDEFLTDPFTAHEQLREAGPVVRLDRYGIWAMARHAEVAAALGDPATFTSGAGVGLADFRRTTPFRPPSLLLETDPPDHTTPRAVITTVLSPKAVRALTEQFAAAAEQVVAELFPPGGETSPPWRRNPARVDGVHDLAEAFPLRVFPDAVGMPAEGRENLLPYGSMVFNSFGPENAHFHKSMVDGAAVRGWVAHACTRAALSPDGLGAQIHDSAAAHGMSEADAELLVRSFLSAGVDTTVHSIGNALHCLATNPDQWVLLRADPSLARAAFEETVRLTSPVQTFFRTTSTAVEVDGATIPAGKKVLLFLAAANRDHRRYPDPHRFDITRRANGHLGFGFGLHACIGQMLARLEGTVLLAALARQVQTLDLDGEPELQLNNTLRGWQRLPLRLTPATMNGAPA